MGDYAEARREIDTLSDTSDKMSKFEAIIALAKAERRDAKPEDAGQDFDHAAKLLRAKLSDDYVTLGRLAVEEDSAGDTVLAAQTLKTDPDQHDALKASIIIATSHSAPADHDKTLVLLKQFSDSRPDPDGQTEVSKSWQIFFDREISPAD